MVNYANGKIYKIVSIDAMEMCILVQQPNNTYRNAWTAIEVPTSGGKEI